MNKATKHSSASLALCYSRQEARSAIRALRNPSGRDIAFTRACLVTALRELGHSGLAARVRSQVAA